MTGLQQMINRNYAQDIRLCERIKFDQALYILTMYQKKIRKPKKAIGSNGLVDAQTEMQDILASWKNKWKMDLTKPILNCVTSVYPRVLIDLSKKENPALDRYYLTFSRFFARFRAEHEDETNFKLVMQLFDRQVEPISTDKYAAASKATVKGFLLMARNLTDLMLKNIEANFEVVNNQMLEVNTDSLEWQAMRPLRYVREIARRALVGQGKMEVENDIEPKCQSVQNLISFSINVMKIMERIKESEHGSTLVTVQPEIEELGLLIHPLLVAISANFKKENNEKIKDFDWSKVEVESIPMMQNLKGSYNSSKIAFLNLDGYESEFNLEFVRNFKKHLLYVSFPKEEAKLDDTRQIYSKRFFKKMMFRYSQSLYESFSDNYMSPDYKALTRIERLSFNPEDYHSITEKLYQHKGDKGNQDFSQNTYVFPVRMSILYEKFKQILENKEDIQNHESYFIRFVIRDFLLNQIREFNPTLIIISYSGRLHIEDHHFVQIIQELTKIGNYKLLLFPNLTSAFVTKEMTEIEDFEGVTCDYDNYIDDLRIKLPLTHHQMEGEDSFHEQWVQLLNKTARFLKVSSGTYNLNRSYEQQPLVSKYKNQYILSYIDELMTVLGKEFANIDKIRFRNKDLSILPKLFQENIRNIKKTFEQTVPRLYFDIYDVIEYLLLDRNNNTLPTRELLLKEYGIELQHYAELVGRLRDEILRKSNYEVTAISVESMGEEIEKEKYKKMKQNYSSLKESHLFQISSEKFQEKVNIYFKTNYENKEYAGITQETESIRGLFEVSFYLAGKVNLKLYESTKVLYKTDQVGRKSQRVPVLIMNNLTDGSSEHCFENYYSQVDLGNSVPVDKKNFEEKKCLAVPIVFEGEQGVVDRERKICILADWNYHQTETYLLLFWPSRYDFLQAFLLKLMNKPYQPPILPHFYYCRRGFKTPVFRRANVSSENSIPGRMGASCFETSGKVYIFGGFYQREKNYLELQHDVVSADLQQFEHNGEAKLLLENLKNRLYSRHTFDSRVNGRGKPNSFVRPRIEFEFFEKEELYGEDDQLQEDNLRTVIMFGGYGQNFLRPYSLLTYYYYVLKFKLDQRSLESIEKKIIYNKAIPINTREMTKNLGVIKTNRKTKTGTLEPRKLADPDAFTLYRNTFSVNSKDGEEDFNYKFKYMFFEEEYRNFKHEIKKIQELRAEQFDSSSINIERDPKNNHIISIEKDGKKKLVTLRMEIPPEKAKKMEGHPREVNLTHQSIICLDIWNSMICAIVRHENYTQGKSVLVQYNTKCLQGFNFEQDVIQYITMTLLKQFDYDLSLHILIICNKNTVAILHGEKLTATDSVKEFIVKRKKNKNEIGSFEIRDREQTIRKNEGTSLINTVFFRNRNKIMSIDFIALDDSYQFYISCQEIELNSPNDQYRWLLTHLDKFDSTRKYEFCFSHKNFVKMEQLKFAAFWKSNNDNYLVVEYGRRKYVCEVTRHAKVLDLLEEGELKLENENMEKGIILNKTEDRYHDHDFM